MPDSSVSPPDAPRNTARAGTQDPFKKDSSDQATSKALANRYAGEANRDAKAPSGGRRLPSNSSNPTSDLSATHAAKTIKDKQYSDAKAIDDASG